MIVFIFILILQFNIVIMSECKSVFI